MSMVLDILSCLSAKLTKRGPAGRNRSKISDLRSQISPPRKRSSNPRSLPYWRPHRGKSEIWDLKSEILLHKNDFLTRFTAAVHNRSQRLRAPDSLSYSADTRETLGSNPYLQGLEVSHKTIHRRSELWSTDIWKIACGTK